MGRRLCSQSLYECTDTLCQPGGRHSAWPPVSSTYARFLGDDVMSDTLKTISPVDGRIYVERPLETGAGIDRALTFAQRAQPAWGSLPLPIRCEILGDAVGAFVAQATDIA